MLFELTELKELFEVLGAQPRRIQPAVALRASHVRRGLA
jgi:hypothetical protein